MTCHKIGRYPMFTRGLGTFSEKSLSLIPKPPQNNTPFISISPLYDSIRLRSLHIKETFLLRLAKNKFGRKLPLSNDWRNMLGIDISIVRCLLPVIPV